MDYVRKLITERRATAGPAAYEPLEDVEAEITDREHARPWSRFSRLEYGIFLLLGVAMLWSWNMFLAAAPYFYSRFQSNDWIATHYQSSILSVSTVTNLGTVYTLAKIQKNVSYTRRITISLVIYCIVFTLLALSTLLKDASVRAYFAFLMVMVFGASLATGIIQNGVFAFVSGFGREEYTQAIMAGQGVAGVLPCLVQIASVLAVPRKASSDQDQYMQGSSPKSAFIYFITATGVSVVTLLAFFYLIKTRASPQLKSSNENENESLMDGAHSKSISLWSLFNKLRYLSCSVALCFTITMMSFPVYTAEILSVNNPEKSRMYDAPVFIPLAFLVWNLGDFLGRMAVAIPRLSLAHRPWFALVFSIARVGFIPLYLLCNINGRGAAVQSDLFYLFVVQFLFGASNGFLASSCMMGATYWVSAEERHAAGGFMSMMLVGGLTAGSLLSFLMSR
ncbi:hypothetical protein N7495_004509 [Penicillium taxi]|uniref:uncharacterized protein n=1 Tax=Penicillium taxi TaxID=168475 RepID=UPI00254528FD|nr:uncharacterized protein N7495_004509 [Penicillium taxi]KAJ5899765.1 hypothetical protein N7495_004509 [Penicillium taxi]